MQISSLRDSSNPKIHLTLNEPILLLHLNSRINIPFQISFYSLSIKTFQSSINSYTDIQILITFLETTLNLPYPRVLNRSKSHPSFLPSFETKTRTKEKTKP